MGEIRIVGPGKTCGYPYPICKKGMSFFREGKIRLEKSLFSESLYGYLNIYNTFCPPESKSLE